MPETIERIAESLVRSPAPVLLPDTSSLLNILEVAVPDERVSANVVPAVLEFLARVREHPPRIWLVLAQVVEEEWLRHHVAKCEKATGSIRKTDERFALLWGVAANLSGAPMQPFAQFAGMQIAQRLHDIAEELVQSAKVIETDANFHELAGRRIGRSHAPASPGKAEFNDCILTEQYLALCRRLRAANFRERCILISSNVRDFGEPKAPKPPLAREFQEVAIDFVYDFAAAAAKL